MFADDTKMYRGIKDSTRTDHNRSQSDFDKLVHWSTTWQLLFNPAKCKHMSLGQSCNTTNYKMTQSDGKVFNIEKSSFERDLGIMIDSGLVFSEHIHSV